VSGKPPRFNFWRLPALTVEQLREIAEQLTAEDATKANKPARKKAAQ
jgi:hypothetical protein